MHPGLEFGDSPIPSLGHKTKRQLETWPKAGENGEGK